MNIREAWNAHGRELEGIPAPAERMKSLAIWHDHIHKDAHPFADLLTRHPARQAMMQLEAEVIVMSYLGGYMAKQGWIEEAEAKVAAAGLGRTMRDKIRGMGVAIETECPTLPTVMQHALWAIVDYAMGKSGAKEDGSMAAEEKTGSGQGGAAAAKCNFCSRELAGGEGRQLTSRELAGMNLKQRTPTTGLIVGMAMANVMHNKPDGVADKPMFWLCGECLAQYFESGVAGQKKWWQIWK